MTTNLPITEMPRKRPRIACSAFLTRHTIFHSSKVKNASKRLSGPQIAFMPKLLLITAAMFFDSRRYLPLSPRCRNLTRSTSPHGSCPSSRRLPNLPLTSDDDRSVSDVEGDKDHGFTKSKAYTQGFILPRKSSPTQPLTRRLLSTAKTFASTETQTRHKLTAQH